MAAARIVAATVVAPTSPLAIAGPKSRERAPRRGPVALRQGGGGYHTTNSAPPRRPRLHPGTRRRVPHGPPDRSPPGGGPKKRRGLEPRGFVPFFRGAVTPQARH